MRSLLRGERGIALPMALMSLLLFSSLSLALVSLAQTEPVIAGNHLLAARARAMAESGLERALWALTESAAPGAFGDIAASGSGVAPPYDGSGFVAVSPTGGFRVTVTGGDPNLRAVRSTGFSPTSDPSDPRPRGRFEIVATLVRVRHFAREAPCVVCAGAAVTLGALLADARGSQATECGAKVAAAGTSTVDVAAGAQLFGSGAPDGPAAPTEGRDWLRNQPAAFFPSSDDLDTLKALAIRLGAYVRAPADGRLELTDVRSGLVFVDSPAGTNAVTAANVARVFAGRTFAGGEQFRGWLIVNGDVTFGAGVDVAGLVYAGNAIAAEGPATVTGLVLARHALGPSPAPFVNLHVRFDCAAARGGGLLPSGWFVKPGTWCDGTAGC